MALLPPMVCEPCVPCHVSLRKAVTSQSFMFFVGGGGRSTATSARSSSRRRPLRSCWRPTLTGGEGGCVYGAFCCRCLFFGVMQGLPHSILHWS